MLNNDQWCFEIYIINGIIHATYISEDVSSKSNLNCKHNQTMKQYKNRLTLFINTLYLCLLYVMTEDKMASITNKVKTNKFMLIAVVLLVIAGVGVTSLFYITSHTVLTPGEQHASKSPFSPLINENNKNPNADVVLEPIK